MQKYYVDAKEVAEATGVSNGKAYEIIRQLNKELKARGFITIAGKVSRQFFNEKYYGYEGARVENRLQEH